MLRQLTDTDLPRFQAYRNDPEVARYQDWEPMMDEEAAKFLRHANTAEFLMPGHWYQLGIADADTALLIGDIGIRVDAEEKEAEIGFTLSRQFQKRGLGKESVRGAIGLIFELTEVDRVIGVTDVRNVASIHLMKALGMTTIEVMDAVFRGEPCVEWVFALTRSEFPER